MRKSFLLNILGISILSSPIDANPYLGEIRWVGFDFAPNGYAKCDGQLLLIEDYDALYDVIGTTYGGDGITTFALPDLRGRHAIAADPAGTGTPPYALGDMGGEEAVTLTEPQMPIHNHVLNARSQNGTMTNLTDNAIAKVSNRFLPAAPNDQLNSSTVSTTGNGQAHNNMQPFLTLNCIISLSGLSPGFK